MQENVDFEGFFFNPNIHPLDEFKRRMETLKEFAGQKGLTVYYKDDFMQDVWENFKGETVERCAMCYGTRLEKTAQFASEKGLDAFTTTLLVSPYQKHDMIKELGEKYASKYGVEFYYRDFRPGFRQGQNEARELKLYRQKFCGCIVSFNESNIRKKEKGK